MKPILVTGGAGFIGSNLCKTLLDRGFEIVVLDNFEDFLYPSEQKRVNIQEMVSSKNFHLIEGDIRDEESLEEAFSFRPQGVVHLAARAGVRPSLEAAPEYSSINVEGTVRVLEACRAKKVSRFIFAGSSSVYGNCPHRPFKEDLPLSWIPSSPYGVSKLAGELFSQNYHELYGMDIFCLRFFSVYGPAQRPDMAIHKFARKILEDEPLTIFGDGSILRDYTYIDDIVAGITSTLERMKGFEIINLGNSRPVKLMDLIHALEKALAKKARIKFVETPPGEMAITYADTTKAYQILSYEPKVELEEGLEKFVQWLNRE